MWPFKKKLPKPKQHTLRDVTGVPEYHEFNRAVKCIDCGKQFVMDTFGGWAVEWNFKIAEDWKWRIDKENFKEAVKFKHNMPQYAWFQVHDHPCECEEEILYTIMVGQYYLQGSGDDLKLVKSQESATRYGYSQAKEWSNKSKGIMVRVATQKALKLCSNGS